MLIADHTNDPVAAETAVRQIETAYENVALGRPGAVGDVF
jgi:hypothetical protein